MTRESRPPQVPAARAPPPVRRFELEASAPIHDSVHGR